jgi:hypothetical protein
MGEAEAKVADIIELAARWLAFDPGEGRLPRILSDLTSEAVALSDGGGDFSADDKPGPADLPVVDEILNTVIDRANRLRRRFAAEIASAGPVHIH